MLFNRKRRRERQQQAALLNQVAVSIDQWALDNGVSRQLGEDNLSLVARVSGTPATQCAAIFAEVVKGLQDTALVEELLRSGEMQDQVFTHVVRESAAEVGLAGEFSAWSEKVA